MLKRPLLEVLHFFHTEALFAFSRTFYLLLGIWERQGSNHLVIPVHCFWMRSLQQGGPPCPQECGQSTAPSCIILSAMFESVIMHKLLLISTSQRRKEKNKAELSVA